MTPIDNSVVTGNGEANAKTYRYSYKSSKSHDLPKVEVTDRFLEGGRAEFGEMFLHAKSASEREEGARGARGEQLALDGRAKELALHLRGREAGKGGGLSLPGNLFYGLRTYYIVVE